MSESDIIQPAFESRQDRARFARSPAFGGIEVMHARFVDHAFEPHTHDDLMIGVMHAGVKRFRRERGIHHVTRHGLSINNAGDLHTGERAEGAAIWYSALYLPQRVLTTLGVPEGFAFRDAVIEDRDVWTCLRDAMAATDRTGAEEALVRGLDIATARWGGVVRPRMAADAPQAIARTIEAMRYRYADALPLVDLAQDAGLSVRHLIRSFEAATGVTPHRYLTCIRIERARDLLRSGTPPAEVAAATGFADQAHLTRVFRATMGTTPGAYRLRASM